TVRFTDNGCLFDGKPVRDWTVEDNWNLTSLGAVDSRKGERTNIALFLKSRLTSSLTSFIRK
ncbi:MAG: hypothetical protein KGQ16_12640, partial [Cyanobacteria bacterium REEB444]|nr:hypothetical protein [Cyanobacteria bacterium REEB444]